MSFIILQRMELFWETKHFHHDDRHLICQSIDLDTCTYVDDHSYGQKT
jgi:hypothetical protein